MPIVNHYTSTSNNRGLSVTDKTKFINKTVSINEQLEQTEPSLPMSDDSLMGSNVLQIYDF